MNELRFCAAFILLFVCSLQMVAQWSHSPDSALVLTRESLNPRIVTDGDGGAIIMWESYIVYRDLHAQRIDKNGYFLWGEEGVPICLAKYGQGGGDLLSDGKGGVFMVWMDQRDSPPTHPTKEIYVQHINSEGQVSWQADGVPVFVGLEPSRFAPQLVAGQDGSIFVVCAGTDGEINNTVRAQKIDRYGNRAWGDSGLVVDDWHCLDSPIAVSDSSGGLYVIWSKYCLGVESIRDRLLAQRINGEGEFQWGQSGRVIHESYYGHYPYRAVSDGENGFILVYRYISEPFEQLVAQRISPEGRLLWKEGKVIVDDVADLNFFDTGPIRDDSRGIIVGWGEKENMVVNYFLQHLDAEGNKIWENKQVKGGHHLISDCLSGAIFAVTKDSLAWHKSIAVNRVSKQGEKIWGESGTLIANNQEIQMFEMAPDGNGGAIIVFVSDFVTYIQKVDAKGQLGGITGVKQFPLQSVPHTCILYQNYPNPFNSLTVLSFELDQAQHTILRILNLCGKEVIRLIDGERSEGMHRIVWNGTDRFGKTVSDGVYFCELRTNTKVDVKKLILIK